jgi:hypothetical protein
MKLTHYDLYSAAHAGVLRRISAIVRQRQEQHGTPTTDLWGVDIEACIAEMLVSLTVNASWRPFLAVPGEIQADVGSSIQVRHTKHDHGCLIVYDHDRDDQQFVLVTGLGLEQKIVGWIHGVDAKKPEHWKASARCPAFFVSQEFLRPIEELANV